MSDTAALGTITWLAPALSGTIVLVCLRHKGTVGTCLIAPSVLNTASGPLHSTVLTACTCVS